MPVNFVDAHPLTTGLLVPNDGRNLRLIRVG